MKALLKTIEYDDEDYTFFLEPITDIHMDDINFDPGKFKTVVNRIKNDKDRWTIGLGDYGSSIYSFKAEKRSSICIEKKYKDDPDLLYNDLYHALYPIRRKMLGLCEGNHDYKIKQIGLHNWVKGLAEELKVPFLTFSSLINLQFIHRKSKTVTNVKLYATHGKYGGIETHGALTKMQRLSSQIKADIFIMGDRHDIAFKETEVLYVNNQGDLCKSNVLYALCGCFVDSYDMSNGDISCWPETMMMYPNKTGTITIAITPFKGKINFHA